MTSRGAGGAESPPSRGLLGNPGFLRFLIARAQSHLGSAMTTATVPLIAAVWLRATPGEVALLVSASFSCLTAGRTVTALVAERTGMRVRAMITIDAALAVTVGAIPVLAATGILTMGRLTVLTALSALLAGAYGSFSGPFMFDLIAPDQVTKANSAISFIGSAAGIAGPGLAGVLIQLLSMPLVLVADASSYLISIALTLPFRGRGASRPRDGGPDVSPVGGVRGFLVVFGRGSRTFVLSGGVVSLVNGMALALLPVYAIRELGLPANVYAGVLGVGAVGGLLGAVAAPFLESRFGRGQGAALSGALALGALCALPAARPGWGAAAGCLAYELVGSFGGAVYVVLMMSSVASSVPRRALARSIASAALVLDLGTAVGAAAGGFVAGFTGVRGALTAGLLAGATVIAALCAPPFLRR
ncbi:MFS transporter [Streptosporangium sp. NPDC000396]|uniref:MFS transporter n=1 Tax=Streptosporangium sp. NPDC000396 TaxID=3366185 RepID=UPI0036BE50B6